LFDKCDFTYEHLNVLFEYNTTFGFEIITNLLRDDGNEEKDVRGLLLSHSIETVYIHHIEHSTKNMMTLIILTSRELTKEEYYGLQ
jgi:hypothetical protein